MDEEIRRVAETGPTSREMERVLNQTEAQFLNQMERVGGKADQLAFYDYFVGTPDFFQADLDRYRRVTAADVQRVARDYLLRAHRVVLSVVPQGRQQLAATQPGGLTTREDVGEDVERRVVGSEGLDGVPGVVDARQLDAVLDGGVHVRGEAHGRRGVPRHARPAGDAAEPA